VKQLKSQAFLAFSSNAEFILSQSPKAPKAQRVTRSANFKKIYTLKSGPQRSTKRNIPSQKTTCLLKNNDRLS
jgi:hypothetical protein